MGFRKDQTGEGFVYAIRSTNPANQNEFKIGLSNDAELRRVALSGTPTPLPFAYERVWAVSNMALAEHLAKNMLSDQSMNPEREFFYIVPTHMLEGVFSSIWHEPEDWELDSCLTSLLDRVETIFDVHSHELQWYEVDCGKLPAYKRQRAAWRRGKPGAMKPDSLF